MLPLATQTAYYAVVAQIIPVFLLILVVGEGRPQPRESRFDPVFLASILVPVAVLLFGELCALRILLGGSETQFLRAGTAVSVSVALGIVVMRMVHSILSDFDPSADAENRPPKHFWLLGVFGFLTTFGAAAVLMVGT